MLLAEGQGGEFRKHLKGFKVVYDVFVYTKPGAKVKHLIID